MIKQIIMIFMIIMITGLVFGCVEETIVDTGYCNYEIVDQWNELNEERSLLVDENKQITKMIESENISYEEYSYKYRSGAERIIKIDEELLYLIKYNEESLFNSGLDVSYHKFFLTSDINRLQMNIDNLSD